MRRRPSQRFAAPPPRDYVHRDDVMAILAWLVVRSRRLQLELAPMLRELVTAGDEDFKAAMARCQAATSLKYAALSAELYEKLRAALVARPAAGAEIPA